MEARPHGESRIVELMQPMVLILIAWTMLSGCGCGETYLVGLADAGTDFSDAQEEIEDGIGDDLPSEDPADEVESDCDGWIYSWPHLTLNTDICEASSDCLDSEIEWNGSRMAVTWSNHGAIFTLIDENGVKVLDDLRLAVAGTFLLDQPVAMMLSWTGTGYGALWRNRPSTPSLVFGVIGQTGEILTAPVLLRPSDCDIKSGALAWNGAGFGVTWVEHPTEGDSVMFTIVDNEGMEQIEEVRLNDPAPYTRVFTEAFERHPGPPILWTGEDFAVAWTQSDGKLILAHIAPDGTLTARDDVVSDAVDIGHVEMADTGSEIALSWDGNLVSDEDDPSALYITRVGPDGVQPHVFLLPEFGS